MKTITEKELKVVLNAHEIWLKCRFRGACADLADTDLRYADFSNRKLMEANMSQSDLSYADFTGAGMLNTLIAGSIFNHTTFGDDIPVIEDIHEAVYLAAAADKAAIDLCGGKRYGTTSNYRAGWVVHLAGEAGYLLECKLGLTCAAIAIYAASAPGFIESNGVPDFSANDEDTLADMKYAMNAVFRSTKINVTL